MKLEDLENIIKKLDSAKPQPSYNLFMSKDSGDYYNAMIAGDKTEMKRISNKMEKQRIEAMQALHKRIGNKHGQLILNEFKLLSEKYGRSNGYNTTHTFAIERNVEDSRFDPEYYSVNIEVKLDERTGKFTKYLSWCDDTGYDQGKEEVV